MTRALFFVRTLYQHQRNGIFLLPFSVIIIFFGRAMSRYYLTGALLALASTTINSEPISNFPITIKPYEKIVIYFGNTTDGFFFPPPVETLRKHAFNILTSINKKLGLERFTLLKPLYGNTGHIITGSDHTSAALLTGDYLISNTPERALMTATADCIPIICIDPVHCAVALIHAGWRSTAQHVTSRVIEQMKKIFNTDPCELQIIFGPGIRGCCYTVDEERVTQLGIAIDGECARKTEDGKLFVDLSVCNQKQLINCGVQSDNIATRFNRCTMCDTQFFSYRREGSRAGRQLSVIALTK